jgi:hypothetical protein
LWRPFWKWRPVEIFQCREWIQYIIIYPHIKFWWYRTMLNFCDIVVAILKMATSRNCSMSEINSGHHYLTTYQIVMISDCWFFAILWWPFWKWRPVEIVQCRHSILDIIIYQHMKWRWNRTMLNFCDISAAILKMATCRNFSMSGINSGHHNLPTYEMTLKLDNLDFVRYCGGHFENGDR